MPNSVAFPNGNKTGETMIMGRRNGKKRWCTWHKFALNIEETVNFLIEFWKSRKILNIAYNRTDKMIKQSIENL